MVNFIENVPIYDGEAYLEQWCRAKGYGTKDSFVCDHASEGLTEEQIENEWDEVTELFYDWCHKNHVNANDC